MRFPEGVKVKLDWRTERRLFREEQVRIRKEQLAKRRQAMQERRAEEKRQQELGSVANRVLKAFGEPRKLFQDAFKDERGGLRPYRACPWRTA